MEPLAALKIPVELRASRRKPDSLAKLKQAGRRLFVKRGCFLDFVEDARQELDSFLRQRVAAHETLEDLIEGTLHAIYEYSETHPGVLNAAMTDELVIDAEGAQAVPLLQRWGADWAETIRAAVKQNRIADIYDADIVGQAILGAI